MSGLAHDQPIVIGTWHFDDTYPTYPELPTKDDFLAWFVTFIWNGEGRVKEGRCVDIQLDTEHLNRLREATHCLSTRSLLVSHKDLLKEVESRNSLLSLEEISDTLCKLPKDDLNKCAYLSPRAVSRLDRFNNSYVLQLPPQAPEPTLYRILNGAETVLPLADAEEIVVRPIDESQQVFDAPEVRQLSKDSDPLRRHILHWYLRFHTHGMSLGQFSNLGVLQRVENLCNLAAEMGQSGAVTLKEIQIREDGKWCTGLALSTTDVWRVFARAGNNALPNVSERTLLGLRKLVRAMDGWNSAYEDEFLRPRQSTSHLNFKINRLELAILKAVKKYPGIRNSRAYEIREVRSDTYNPSMTSDLVKVRTNLCEAISEIDEDLDPEFTTVQIKLKRLHDMGFISGPQKRTLTEQGKSYLAQAE
ncbi:MAG: hypothetical protein AMXMBFR84_16640 [Candidatus Hydrogenedentota bacterium]